MRTVLVLMDTLRRDALACYNPETMAKTPNLDAFAKEATVFDQHWIGSAPCMPARRDVLCGRLNFLERSWGPIEPFDVTLPAVLKEHGVYSHITTDHCHYMRTGGEGYLQQFTTWDYHRGQEGDPWISRIDEPTNMPESFYGRVRRQYQLNRQQWEQKEEEMPSPKTFQSACDWLNDNQGKDQFFLMVEAFDPHEPFDVPQKYLDMVGGAGKIDRDYYEIPQYKRVSEAEVPTEAVDYLQRRYAALVTMSDHWFGELIKKLKALDMYEDTMVIVTTDHGYFLGERDYLGKNYMHLYNELAHLPLIIKYPNGKQAGQRVSKLTQNIDIMPTVLDFENIAIPSCVQGVSLKPLADDLNAKTKAAALFGYHGMAVNITDGHYTYFRAPKADNQPLYEYTASPTTIRRYLGVDVADKIEMGRYFKRTDFPLFKIPASKPGIIDQSDEPLKEVAQSKLFDITKDYAQQHDLCGTEVEAKYIDLLSKTLDELDAPADQKQRLGLE